MGKRRKGKERAHVRLARELARTKHDLAESARMCSISRDEVQRKNEQIVSKNEAIMHRDRELEIAKEKVAAKELELKRVDRLVDQFLSVQIIGHGQQVTPTVTHASQTNNLRRT